VALAAGVAAVGQSDVWFPLLSEPSIPGPRGPAAVMYAVLALTLVARRRAPLTSFCVLAAVMLAWTLANGATEGAGSLLPALISVYSVARYGSRRASWVVAVVMTLLVVVRELNNPDTATWQDLANALAWDLTLVAAWLLGAYLRTRRLYIAGLQEQVERAERERVAREAQAAERATTQERARIAHELHDVVAHGVSMMVLQANAAEVTIESDPRGAAERMRTVDRAGREALVELRRLLGLLRPDETAAMAPPPGLDALPALVERVARTDVNVELSTHGEPAAMRPGLDQTAYRLVQEALTNVLKHSNGSSVSVSVTYEADALDVVVEDNGSVDAQPPAAGEPPGSGFGLNGMRSRVELYGGSLRTGPAEGGGFRVHARFPREVDA
jgi:signal transduction histidine kinase